MSDLQDEIEAWRTELDRRLLALPDDPDFAAWRAKRHDLRRALVAEVAGFELPPLAESRSLAWLCDGDGVPLVVALLARARQNVVAVCLQCGRRDHPVDEDGTCLACGADVILTNSHGADCVEACVPYAAAENAKRLRGGVPCGCDHCGDQRRTANELDRIADDPAAVAEVLAERDPDGRVPCKWPEPCTCNRCVDEL